MSKPPSKVVFVGNIPYGLSEEQISEIFSTAGRVVNFRLVYDKETGRAKGFGFAEYPDTDSAASAVRNLNDHEIMGRKLRVDFSNDGGDEVVGGSSNISQGYQPPNGTTTTQPQSAPPPAATPLSLPPGRDLPPGISCNDAISRTLNTLPPTQLLDVLREMKTMATNDPARAAQLLTEAPQLTYAILQAMLLMGLVTPEAINSVVDESTQPQGIPAGVAVGGGAVDGVGGAGAGQGRPAANPQASGELSDNPEALMKMVMDLPMEAIEQLPEDERNQIMQLRQSYMAHR